MITWSCKLYEARDSRHVGTWSGERASYVGTRIDKHARHVNMWGSKHSRHVGTWVRENANHVGTWGRKHARHVGNWARKHTQGTLAREDVRTQDTLARENVSTQGTLAREHVFSTQGTQFGRLTNLSRIKSLVIFMLFIFPSYLLHKLWTIRRTHFDINVNSIGNLTTDNCVYRGIFRTKHLW